MSRALVEKRAPLSQASARAGEVLRSGARVPERGERPPPCFQGPPVRTYVPAEVFEQLPAGNGSRRRVVTRTTTERFAIEDDVSGQPEPPLPRAIDREGLLSRALRLFVAATAFLLTAILCAAGAGLMVQEQVVGALLCLVLAVGLGVVARECWSYEHG